LAFNDELCAAGLVRSTDVICHEVHVKCIHIQITGSLQGREIDPQVVSVNLPKQKIQFSGNKISSLCISLNYENVVDVFFTPFNDEAVESRFSLVVNLAGTVELATAWVCVHPMIIVKTSRADAVEQGEFKIEPLGYDLDAWRTNTNLPVTPQSKKIYLVMALMNYSPSDPVKAFTSKEAADELVEFLKTEGPKRYREMPAMWLGDYNRKFDEPRTSNPAFVVWEKDNPFYEFYNGYDEFEIKEIELD
jgi:hypothetical protein